MPLNFSTRQFAFVLRPVTKNGQRKSSVCGIFSGQMLLSVKFRGEVVGERSHFLRLWGGGGGRTVAHGAAVTRLGKRRPQTTAMRAGDRGDIRATTLFGNCHFVSAPGLTKFREDRGAKSMLLIVEDEEALGRLIPPRLGALQAD